MAPSHYAFATALLSEYRAEVEKAQSSIRTRLGLATDGDRILALAQAHATLAVADALRAAEGSEA